MGTSKQYQESYRQDILNGKKIQWYMLESYDIIHDQGVMLQVLTKIVFTANI